MKLFLIAGKAGSGKNEVAKIIKEYFPFTVVTAFSKYIKLYSLELTNWDGQDATKPRAFLQSMGDKLRAIDEDFLTKRVKEDLEVYRLEGIENVVISDVRLIHEIDYFKKRKDIDVITIRVNCDYCHRSLNPEEKKHHTETELDDYGFFDYVIENKFDENLKKEVIEILKGLK